MHHLHHLLLIDHDSIRLCQERIDRLVDQRHHMPAMLARVVIRNQTHRTRAEQCVGCNQILESVGLHVCQQSTHAARFKLEHSASFRTAEQAKDALVIKLNTIEIQWMRTAIATRATSGVPNCLVRHGVTNQLLCQLNS